MAGYRRRLSEACMAVEAWWSWELQCCGAWSIMTPSPCAAASTPEQRVKAVRILRSLPPRHLMSFDAPKANLGTATTGSGGRDAPSAG